MFNKFGSQNTLPEEVSTEVEDASVYKTRKWGVVKLASWAELSR